MSLKPLALLVACSGAWSSTIHSQTGAIRGAVADSATGIALAGVRVTATAAGGPRAVALTDAAGRFRLTGLPAGRYDLDLARIGYRPQRVAGVVADTAPAALGLILAGSPVSLDPLVVSPSRSLQSGLDAPASVSVVGRSEIEQATAFTPVDRVRDVPGMDLSSKGLMQHTFAVRGERNANSGAVLFLTDHRLAAVPSIGFNVPYLVPTTSDDVERIEVTRGPGAALYGPDSDRGVVHVLTRSPFDSRGMSLSLTGGERSLWQASGRYAVAVGARFGFKVSGEYFRGRDWENASLESQPNDSTIRRAGGEALVEWRPADGTQVVGTFGLSQAINNVDLTPEIGGVQVRDWRYSYLQGRMYHRRLFANVIYNWSDAGETVALGTGNTIVDRSRLLAAQVQHSATVGPTTLLYGLDARWTDPRTGGTIHGSNENDDLVSETGGYVHAATPLAPPWTLVTALRADHHNRLDDFVVSPRVGLLFRVAPAHVLRLTYNHGFSSPDPSDLFVDIVAEDSLGGLPYGVRVRGVPTSGYSFRRDCGGLCMRSPFNPGGAAQFLPADATLMWPAVVGILQAQGIDISNIPAPNGSQVATELHALNLQTGSFGPNPVAPADITDFAGIRRTITNALELGYKGVFGDRVRIELDVYRNHVYDPFGESAALPNVFHERQTLEQYLANYRSPTEAAGLAGTIVQIPVGTITPDASGDLADVLVLKRQGGSYTLWGADIGIHVRLTDRLAVQGSYSWLSEDSLPNVATVGDVVLSVPRNKGALALRYHDERTALAGRVEGRAVSSFPVVSGVYSGRVDSYAVLDAGVGFPLPGGRVQVTLDAYNLLDARHREYVGAPELGRLVVARLLARF